MKNDTLVLRAAAALALAACAALPAQAQTFSVGSEAPSSAEQTSLDLINRFRADPQGELARMLGTTTTSLYSGVSLSSTGTAGDGTAWSSNFWQSRASVGNSAASAMDSFKVNPGDLLKQWSLLPTAGSLSPYAWNGNLGSSAQQYSQLVVTDAGNTANPHNIAPYALFDFNRYNDAGYNDAGEVGENIARNFPANVAQMHAGFAVDWGGAVPGNGIQNPTGHRDSMLSATFTEVGIGIVDGYGSGRQTQVQHFGDRFDSSSEYLWGYAWQDALGGSYTFGEGMQGRTVNIKNGLGDVVATGTTDANGGYIVQVVGLSSGNYTVELMDGTTSLGSQLVTIGSAGMYNANFQITAVPEPETYAMMLLGLGVLGWAGKRRKAA